MVLMMAAESGEASPVCEPNVELDVYSSSWWLIDLMLQPARVLLSLPSVDARRTPMLDEGAKR